MDGREFLVSNLERIERAVAFASRRYRLDAQDAEELGSIVKLKLVENDYAVLREFEGRSSFGTYISIVVQRVALDYCIHRWGKWHTSAEARRLGPQAEELEQLIRREGRSIDDAATILASRHEGVTRESLRSLAARLPERAPRPREVALEETEMTSRAAAVDEHLLAAERQRVAEQLSKRVAEIIESLPEDDRLILELRYQGGMTVAQIARAFHIDQKLLYRRIERGMREIRVQLERSGIARTDALELIGDSGTILDFHLRKPEPRPSIVSDETVAAESEDSP